MKCVGIDHWIGIHPLCVEVITDLEKFAVRARRAEEQRRRQMTPSQRFFFLANERFGRLKKFGIAPMDGWWRIGQWTLAEFTKMRLPDAEDSDRFLVHLQSFYVVDTARGTGEGGRSLAQIKEIAEESGCGVTLFARAFALSRDGCVPNAIETFEELWKAAAEEEWPVVYQPEWDAECLRFFYAGCGFRNMCLYDSSVYARPKEEDLPFESQFVYLPTSMDPASRQRIENRLNRDLCEFCNR